MKERIRILEADLISSGIFLAQIYARRPNATAERHQEFRDSKALEGLSKEMLGKIYEHVDPCMDKL